MLRIVLFSLILCLPAFSFSASAEEKDLVVQDTIDFGTVLPKSQVTRSIDILNRGKNIRKIVEVTTSCSCAVVDFKPFTVAPGENASIRIQLDIPNSFGGAETQLAIRTDESVLPISIKYDINALVRVVPERTVNWLNACQLPESIDIAVQCTKRDATLESVEVESPVPWLKFQTGPVGGKLCTIRVEIAKGAPSGLIEIPFRARVKLAGSDSVYMPLGYICGAIGETNGNIDEFFRVNREQAGRIKVSVPHAALPTVKSGRLVGENLGKISIEKENDGWYLIVPPVRHVDFSGSMLFADDEGTDRVSIPFFIGRTISSS